MFGLNAQQFSSQVFHDGYLVTNAKDSLKGKLKYDLETNNVTLVHSGKTYSFSSQKIFYFEILDEILNNYRQFYSVPYHINFDYKVPVFFEVLYEGKLSLLRRERIVARSANNTSAYWGGGNMMRNTVEYTFFFLDSEGNIARYTGKRKELYRYLSDKEIDLKQFMKKNKLNTDRTSDLVRIVAFYNSI